MNEAQQQKEKQILGFLNGLFSKLFKKDNKKISVSSSNQQPIMIKTIKTKSKKYFIHPRSDEAFIPFLSMPLAEWKLHPFHRLGSSYLARLRNSQGK